MFFKPIKKIDFDSAEGDLIRKIIQNDICLYSAHTNLDAGDRSLSQTIAEKLQLLDIKPLNLYKTEELLKIVVFVPLEHVEAVRAAINGAGAGYIGRYSDCSFRTAGTGTFCPGEGTTPFIGETGQLEEVDEYRLETIVYKKDLKKVIQAMLNAHPYEEVAYDIYPLKNEGKIFSMGRKGRLQTPLKLRQLAADIKEALGLDTVRIAGELDQIVGNLAIVSGAGSSFINNVADQHIDVLITGDVKYHEAKEAVTRGLAIIDAGHQGMERLIGPHLCDILNNESVNNQWQVTFIAYQASDLFKEI
jgi:dinuclear metal center YbgI/SA1388 family protein